MNIFFYIIENQTLYTGLEVWRIRNVHRSHAKDHMRRSLISLQEQWLAFPDEKGPGILAIPYDSMM